MIKVKCPNAACGKVASVKDEFAGRRAKCPACGTAITIPGGPAEAAPASAVRAPASRPPAPPPAPAPAAEEYEDYEEAAPRRRAGKSGQVTAIAIVNFVLGGLSLLGGLCGLLFGGLVAGLGSATPTVQVKGNVPPEMAKQFQDLAKAQVKVGGTLALLGTIVMIMSVLSLAWGGAAIADGVGVLQRRSWGRLLAMILAGVAGVMGLIALVTVFMGNLSGLVSVLLYGAYAAWVIIVMLKPEVAREFS